MNSFFFFLATVHCFDYSTRSTDLAGEDCIKLGTQWVRSSSSECGLGLVSAV